LWKKSEHVTQSRSDSTSENELSNIVLGNLLGRIRPHEDFFLSEPKKYISNINIFYQGDIIPFENLFVYFFR
jgi:hypothetical protein